MTTTAMKHGGSGKALIVTSSVWTQGKPNGQLERKQMSKAKDEVFELVKQFDTLREAVRASRSERRAMRCTEASAGDDITPGCFPCELAEDDDRCDACKARKKAQCDLTLFIRARRSVEQKIHRRLRAIAKAEPAVRASEETK